VGFNTGEIGESLTPPGSTERHFTIFIPTTPNPTSGFLLILPQSKVKPLDISVETAVKLVLTGGMVKN
jgi:uncharacterized membrane protein